MTSSSAASISPSTHLHITTTNPPSSLTTKPHPQQPSPHSQSQSSSISPRSGTSAGGGTNQACAACKYQRRKCNPDCALAPYFPADQQRRFLNAHKLFGVSNILKTLKRLKPEHCDEAMRTLIYQAEMRALDPVGGCCRLIVDLERQLELDTAELSALIHHLTLCREAAAALPPDLEVTSSNQQTPLLAVEQEVVDALYTNDGTDATILHQASPQDHGEQQQQQLFDYFYYESETTPGTNKPGVDINVDIMPDFDYDDASYAPADDHKVEPAAEPDMSPNALDHYQIDQKEYEMKVASLVDVFDVNADIDVKEELQEEDTKDSAAIREAAQMAAAESSHCRLGLGFSSF